MLMSDLNIVFTAIMPEILVTCLALVVLVLDFFLRGRSKLILGYLAMLGLLAILPVAVISVVPEASFGGTVTADRFAAFFNVIFILAGTLALAVSTVYLKHSDALKGEYYVIILFATLGMMVMASASDLMSIYVGLELMALCFYILVALGRDTGRSMEGALKYFILGAFSSGIFLYGMSFAYGFSGSTNLADIARQAELGAFEDPFLVLAVVLIAVGFAFKVALFPFHLWAPDAYQGAPTPVAALLSVGSKAAAFAVFMRIFLVAFPEFQPQWSKLMWLLSALTMIFGSVVAISQKNIIRMLAYSSIAHAGMIVIGLLVFNRTGVSGVLYYLLVYLFMNLGAFSVVALAGKTESGGLNISDCKGLAARYPLTSLFMALFLLALAGVPPTGGFTAKFFILASAVDAGYYWLAALGVTTTAVALFFYARVIYYMYMKEPEGQPITVQTGVVGTWVLLIAAAGTLISGLYPAPFMEFATHAIEPLIR